MMIWKSILSVWTWFEIGLVTMLGFFPQVVLFVLTAPFDPRRAVVGRFFRLIAVTEVKLSPMWRFGVHGDIPRGINPRTVVISNHVSHLDSFLISHLPWEMKWLAKESLFKVPFLGWGMRLAGDIKVRRGTGTSVAVAMQRCKEYIEMGMPVCIFPEGTRSTTQEMLPFKDGAFRLAIETGADILPLAVAGTRHGLAKHSWRFNFCRARVTVGKPIPTAGLTIDDVARVKAEARAQIEHLLATIAPLASV